MLSFRFLRTVKHTPVRQLLWRFALMVKRRMFVAVNSRNCVVRTNANNVPLRSIDSILPLWPAPVLSRAVSTPSGWQFNFLNQSHDLGRPVDWHRAELNKGTRLWKLHLHYFDWIDALTDVNLVELVDDWIEHNPPYRAGYWLDGWNSYAISIRVVSWMGELARRRSSLDARFVDRLEHELHMQLQFLLNNLELDIGGNHVIKNIKALYWGSRYFNSSFANLMEIQADRLLAKELDRQILADGFHFELSPAYHSQVFADLLDVWRLMNVGVLQKRLSLVLASMAQVVADMTHPDEYISLFNDGGLTMTHPPAQVLAAYSLVLGKSAPTAQRFTSYSSAGYYIYRGSKYLLIYDAGRVGPDGLPAHSHGDIFSFELSVACDRFIVDAGVYEYNSGDQRSRSRSTAMHNTLTLDDIDQCEFWDAFRMGRRAQVQVNEVCVSAKYLIVDAEHNGYSHLHGKPRHRRRIESSFDGLVRVYDEVIGGSGQQVISRLLLHPSVNIERLDPYRLILHRGSMSVEFAAEVVSLSIEKSVWWPDFGKEEETYMLVIQLGCAPAKGSYEIRLY